MITDFSTTYSLPILNPRISPVSAIIPDADNQILYTNNVNYIYVKLLNLIRNEINQKIGNSSDVMTSHDIDLYRIITI